MKVLQAISSGSRMFAYVSHLVCLDEVCDRKMQFDKGLTLLPFYQTTKNNQIDLVKFYVNYVNPNIFIW